MAYGICSTSRKVIQIKQVLENSRAKLARKQLNLPLGSTEFVDGLGAEALPARVLYRVGPRRGGQFAAVGQGPHEALFAVVRPRRCCELEGAHLVPTEEAVKTCKKLIRSILAIKRNLIPSATA